MRITIGLVSLFLSTVLSSQLNHPKVSPAAVVVQEIGFTTVKVEYSRPAAKGRRIFGDLVPYKRIWRVGANESTKFSVDNEVSILGNTLLAGTYALYAFPDKDIWEIVFHENTEHWGDGRKGYDPKEDAFRVSIKPQTVQDYQENFLVAFDSISHDRAQMILGWAHTRILVPITVNTRQIMEEQIKERLSRQPTAQTYYEIARYYVEQNMKYDTALVYVNRAIELDGDTYYFHRIKSLVEAELDDYKSAVISAQKSLELAKVQDKDEFVRMNQKNIDLWNSKLKK